MIVNPFFWWSLLPIFGWAVALFFQGFEVFGFGRNWEERKIMEEMVRLEEEEEAKQWLLDRRRKREEEEEREAQAEQYETNEEDEEYDLLESQEELELKEFQKLRKEWDDQEFV